MENISNSDTAQENINNRVRASNIIYRAIIVFLLLLIFSISLFFVGVLKKLSYIPSDVSEIVLETVVCKYCPKNEIEENVKENIPNIKNEISLRNEGWAKYVYSEYGFSVEIPNTVKYNTTEEELEDIPYIWDIKSRNEMSKVNEYGWLDNFVNRIEISNYPYNANTCQEIGCANDSALIFDFYKNTDNLNLSEIKSVIKKNIESKNSEADIETPSYTIFGKEAFKVIDRAGDLMSIGSEYVFLNNGYVVYMVEVISEDALDYESVKLIKESILFE